MMKAWSASVAIDHPSKVDRAKICRKLTHWYVIVLMCMGKGYTFISCWSTELIYQNNRSTSMRYVCTTSLATVHSICILREQCAGLLQFQSGQASAELLYNVLFRPHICTDIWMAEPTTTRRGPFSTPTRGAFTTPAVILTKHHQCGAYISLPLVQEGVPA